MGGRGASSGNSANIIAFNKRINTVKVGEEWDYRGEREYVEKLENALNTRNGMQSLANLSIAIKREDDNISKLIATVERGDEQGDVKALLTLRRRIRQLSKKVQSKRGM